MSVHSRQDIPFLDLAGAAGDGDVLMRFGLPRALSSMRLRLWPYKILESFWTLVRHRATSALCHKRTRYQTSQDARVSITLSTVWKWLMEGISVLCCISSITRYRTALRNRWAAGSALWGSFSASRI